MSNFDNWNTNNTINTMKSISIEGNVIDDGWFHTIVKDYRGQKTPYTDAILILSEIVYWYRPTYKKTSDNRGVWQKKFKGDALQKNYDDLGKRFNFGYDKVKECMKFLKENIKVIDWELRPIPRIGGSFMFIKLDANRLIEISSHSLFNEIVEETEETGDIENSEVEGCRVNSPQGVVSIHPTPEGEFTLPYTKTTTKTTTKNKKEVVCDNENVKQGNLKVDKKTKTNHNVDYQLDKFEMLCSKYPSDVLPGIKEKALHHWKKKIEKGISADEILKGLEGYIQFLSEKKAGYTKFLLSNFIYNDRYKEYKDIKIPKPITQRMKEF